MKKNIAKFLAAIKEYLFLLLLLTISLIVISLNDNPQIKNIRALAFGSFAFFTSTITEATSIFDNDDELAELREINARLMLQVNKLREYGIEYNELKRMLAFRDTSDYSLTPAKIISKSVSKIKGVFVINVGSIDSIKVGMPVIDYAGLIGLITNVEENFSVVRTLKNHELKIAVVDQRSGVNGILTWNGKHFVIKNIPTTYDVTTGDRIITSSFSTIVPPSIPIGIVIKRETSVSGVLSNVLIQPYTDFTHQSNLFVVNIIQSKKLNEFELNLLKSD